MHSPVALGPYRKTSFQCTPKLLCLERFDLHLWVPHSQSVFTKRFADLFPAGQMEQISFPTVAGHQWRQRRSLSLHSPLGMRSFFRKQRLNESRFPSIFILQAWNGLMIPISYFRKLPLSFNFKGQARCLRTSPKQSVPTVDPQLLPGVGNLFNEKVTRSRMKNGDKRGLTAHRAKRFSQQPFIC